MLPAPAGHRVCACSAGGDGMRGCGTLGVVARSAVGLALSLWMAGEAIGQISTGGIRGFVRDESRAGLPGVTIEASSPALIGGTTSTTSDAQGLYRFENLPIGIYSVSFTMSGFKTIRREGIRVEAGRTIELEQALGIGTL